MKKQLMTCALSLMLIGASAGVSYQTVKADDGVSIETEFGDAYFRDYVSTNIDLNHDGVLSTDERNAVQTIKNLNAYTSSIDGIDNFPNLTELNVSSCKLTELNLSGNTSLVKVNADSNKITTVNVSGCTEMENLNVSNNFLTEIKVDDCKKLQQLSITNNSISTLDVSMCEKLWGLHVANNNLSELNVASNVHLTEMTCGHNPFTKLNIENNTELEYLNAVGTQISELDISNNLVLNRNILVNEDVNIITNNKLAAPTGISIEEDGNTSYLTWDKVDGATWYDVFHLVVEDDGTTYWYMRSNNATDNKLTFELSDKNYSKYMILARNDSEMSPLSAVYDKNSVVEPTPEEPSPVEPTSEEGEETIITGWKLVDGEWYYYVNGEVYDGHKGNLVYGIRAGFKGWSYVRDGKFFDAYTGLAKATTGKWYFVRNGVLCTSYSGLCQNEAGNWYYVGAGRLDLTVSGMIVPATNGKWYYIVKGRPNTQFSNMVAPCLNGNYYYCVKGRPTKNITDKAAKGNDGEWYYVKNGRVDFSYTGLALSLDGQYRYMKGGKFNPKTNKKVVEYKGKKYRIVNGIGTRI